MGSSWTCDGCGVVASYGAGTVEPKQPEGWMREHGAWLCLRCRREHAMDEASNGTTAENKAQRRRALTEFELRRDPDASDQLIGRRARCPSRAVKPVRTALLKEGTLQPSGSAN